jgi:hypothetical protein
MYSIAARAARERTGGESTDPDAPALTPTGLPKRVPGAQRPDAAFGRTTATPPIEESEPARTSPEDVYSFLSSFQSGVARGRAEAHGDPTSESQEEGR